MDTSITEVCTNQVFSGFQKIYSHHSKELGCMMRFAVYIPPHCGRGEKVPVLYWLSGLECNETNFIQKSGVQRYASDFGYLIVCPDTSPRGLNIPGDKDSWDFGEGASFYLDATEEPWKKNYRMFSYVTVELVNVINANFPCDGKQSIMGHSMGGHGALICALKTNGLYKSVSAFAPICNPSESAWGIKAFTGYLGPQEKGLWAQWDATELVKSYDGPPLEIFIDQGTNDKFLPQLLPDNLVAACKEAHFPIILKMREGYDHSYYYIATFLKEHMKYHENYLKLF